MKQDVSVAMAMLRRRGVELEHMARLVQELQQPFHPQLTLADCLASVRGVVAKREVQYAVITGLTLDEMAEEGSLQEPLGSIVREDHALYGIDAMLALAIVNMYGSIGMSNYGFLARRRDYLFRYSGGPQNKINTFLDDLVAAIVAAACARIAHGNWRGPGGAGQQGGRGSPPAPSPSPTG